jgi:hypothetical protein
MAVTMKIRLFGNEAVLYSKREADVIPPPLLGANSLPQNVRTNLQAYTMLHPRSHNLQTPQYAALFTDKARSAQVVEGRREDEHTTKQTRRWKDGVDANLKVLSKTATWGYTKHGMKINRCKVKGESKVVSVHALKAYRGEQRYGSSYS